MEGIIEKALKEDLPDILNLQKKAFEKGGNGRKQFQYSSYDPDLGKHY